MRISRRLVVAASLFVLGFAAPTMAQSALGSDPSITAGRHGGQTPLPVLEQARRYVDNITPQVALASAVQIPTAARGNRTRDLTIGSIGVGTAVAGIFVYRSREEFQLPGLVDGKEIAGQAMMIGGGALGAIYLWRALR